MVLQCLHPRSCYHENISQPPVFALCSSYQPSLSHADMVLLQIMADALTMWEELGRIENTKVSIATDKLKFCMLIDQHAPAW